MSHPVRRNMSVHLVYLGLKGNGRYPVLNAGSSLSIYQSVPVDWLIRPSLCVYSIQHTWSPLPLPTLSLSQVPRALARSIQSHMPLSSQQRRRDLRATYVKLPHSEPHLRKYIEAFFFSSLLSAIQTDRILLYLSKFNSPLEFKSVGKEKIRENGKRSNVVQ